MRSPVPVLLLALGLASAHAASQPVAQTIRSRAQLNHYLEVTPLARSPLGALSPGGRKRFLARLTFNERGVTSLPLADAANELDASRVTALFDLFGEAKQADGVGLSPGEYARRHAERVADAARRQCAPATCPESRLEQAYDALVLDPHEELSDRERRLAIARAYDRLFAPWQSGTTLRSVSNPDLRLAWLAADQGTWGNPDASHVTAMRRVLDEMHRRDIAGDRAYALLYDRTVAARQFEDAAALAAAHPGIGAAKLPHFVAHGPLPADRPTALAIDPASDTMQRQPVRLGGPLRIVVIAGCHFSEDAARAIGGDPELRRLFSQHATWLAAPEQPIADVVQWDRAFPAMPMHVAWNADEWSMLPDWGMPTYYIYRNGRQVTHFNGWLGIDALRAELRKAGALR